MPGGDTSMYTIAKTGPKTQKVQQTFALYEGEVRVVQRLKAFRRVCMVLAEHLPAMQEGDCLALYAPHEQLVGEAIVLEYTHIKMSRGDMKTAMAIRMEAEPVEAKLEANMEERDG